MDGTEFTDDDWKRIQAGRERDSKKQNIYYKKLWENHQNNEYLRVNKYKEARCFSCHKFDIATATLIDSCPECLEKKGQEAMLAKVSQKFNGLCFFCGQYKFYIWQINCRLCMTCNGRVREVLKWYNTNGHVMGTNPFWKSIRRKLGKDWQILFQDGTGSSVRR